jgi:hypothetical protein
VVRLPNYFKLSPQITGALNAAPVVVQMETL